MKFRQLLLVVLLGILSASPLLAQTSVPAVAPDNIGHHRHLHAHNPPHPKAVDARRFFTSRTGAELPLPSEQDAFFFVVFGDRTGGPAKGVSVLADAVRDVNLLEPDLVMTVGDLVEGYTQEGRWLAQMREYKVIMNRLLCPWFPVAGNHDVYWGGPEDEKPVGENEAVYELHFGPLWYAFEHKNCWFIALFSDEGNPETGKKSFGRPECQRMSPAQFDWLAGILHKAEDADHVFLFLHHPRWLGGRYGDDWDRVHDLLVKAGNVTGVFAGHIHHMRYDPHDGIEYITLATVGGHQSGAVPSAGYLHEFHIVTVRKDQIAVAAIPVGEVMDPREITGEMQTECVELANQPLDINSDVMLARDGGGRGDVTTTLKNTTSRPIHATIMTDSRDARWMMKPDHHHIEIEPGAEHAFTFDIGRLGDSLDKAYRPLELAVQLEYLGPGFRYPLPERRVALPIAADIAEPPQPAEEHVLQLISRGAHARVPSSSVQAPDGPLTLECWVWAKSFDRHAELLAKTESSEYGIYVREGRASFVIHLDGKCANASTKEPILKPEQWHHIAGVYDGRFVSLYVDGQRVAQVKRSGKRTLNDLPLMIGAGVDGSGAADSLFRGAIDEVRLSSVARYIGERFTPERRFAPDDDALLLLHMDDAGAHWLYDASPQQAHPMLMNNAAVGRSP